MVLCWLALWWLQARWLALWWLQACWLALWWLQACWLACCLPVVAAVVDNPEQAGEAELQGWLVANLAHLCTQKLQMRYIYRWLK